jgi:hypothetical protein
MASNTKFNRALNGINTALDSLREELIGHVMHGVDPAAKRSGVETLRRLAKRIEALADELEALPSQAK